MQAGKLSETELGERVSGVTDAALARRTHRRGEQGDSYVRLRASAEGTLHVRAVSTTDARNRHPETSVDALFRGTYDVAAGRWPLAEAHIIKASESTLLSEASSSRGTGAKARDSTGLWIGS